MLFSKRFRWAWFICLLLLAGFLTNSISSYLLSRSNVRKTIIQTSLPLTSDNVYSEIQRDLLRPVFIASLMAHDTFVRDWVLGGETDADAITRFLHQIQIKYGTVTSFFVSEKTRKYYQSHGLLKEIREDDFRDEWYFRVRDMEAPYEINVDPDLANRDEMTIFINYRVLDYTGNFIGAAGVGLTVNRVNNLISNYEAKFDRQIYFVDESGKMVLRPSNSPMLEYSSLQDVEGLEEIAPELLAGNRANVTYKHLGETRMLNARFVSELGWFLIVEQSEDTLMAPYRKQLLSNIVIAVLITILVAWRSLVAIKRNQNRLEQQNIELEEINRENKEQQRELALAARELEASNHRLSELNQEKTEYINIVAHDLQTPLSGILGHCQLAELDGIDDPQTFVQDIQYCGDRMLNMTRMLLDSARIESVGEPIEWVAVSLNHSIEEAIAQLRKPAEHKHIRMEIDIGATVGLQIPSNHHWLSICLNNLLSNAVKYTPPYGVVSVTTRADPESPDHVELAFTDTGPGINVRDREKMFGKFVRLSARPTGQETSTGLGLYVVKKTCDRLGIQIQVHSQLGEGSTFTLKIPKNLSKENI